MKLPRRRFLHLAAGAVALPVISRVAWAQTYPMRPVRMIVGLTPGSGPDILARHHKTAAQVAEPSRVALAEQLSASSGPLQETLLYAEPRRIGDLASDHRWPDFNAAAINAGLATTILITHGESGRSRVGAGGWPRSPASPCSPRGPSGPRTPAAPFCHI